MKVGAMARARRPAITDMHMLVLAWNNRHPLAFPEDVAAGLGWPVAVVETLCADLQAAGMIAEATQQ